MEVQLGVWNPAGTPKCIVLTISIPPPHIWRVWCVERAIHTESWGTQFLSTQCPCHSVFIFIISDIISLLHLTLRKSKFTLFRLLLQYCPTRSLGFLEFCSNSPILWPPLTRSSLPSDCPESRGLNPDSPPSVAAKSPLRAFLGWFTYTVYCALLYIFHSNSVKFFFLFVHQTFSTNAWFQLSFNS